VARAALPAHAHPPADFDSSPAKDRARAGLKEDPMSTTDVVVGVDGSPASWRALRWATTHARRRGSRLHIVAAYRTPWLPAGFAAEVDPTAGELSRIEELVDEMVEMARRAAPAIVVNGLAAWGSPVEVLTAAATDGSLIVVGNRGHSDVASLLLGATSLQLATHASAPVVVVRGNAEADSGPVVVGADGSPGAEPALGLAFDEAAARGCTLMAVRAYHVPVPGRGQHVDPVDLDSTRLRAAELASLRDSIGPWREKYPHVAVQPLVVRGDVASVLVAMSSAAQLVVVGTRGHGGFAGLLLGSVGQKLLHHAHCPVLIAR
jgi:nucleotide-binding universal stress UspA family protein